MPPTACAFQLPGDLYEARRAMTAFTRPWSGLIAVVILTACGSSAPIASATTPTAQPVTPAAVASTPDNMPCPRPTAHAANWPVGGPVPGELSGTWNDIRNPSHVIALHCNDFNISQVIYGNVVVRGSKIDFIQESAGADPNGGFVCDAPSGDRPVLVIEYDWTLTGGQLQITRTSANPCHWVSSGTMVLKRSVA